MSRRKLTYAVLVVASLVASACAQPMAPTMEDTTCRGWVNGSGFKCGSE